MCRAPLTACGVVVLLAFVGCSGFSPFSLDQNIANDFAAAGAGGGGGGAASQPAGGTVSLTTCDLKPERRIITRMSISNFSLHPVEYNLTFLATAGPGGF